MNENAGDETPLTTNGWTFADVWETVAECVPDADALIHGPIRTRVPRWLRRRPRIATHTPSPTMKSR